MATSYPGALDTLTNPTGTDTLNSPDHAAQHTNANDAIEAIQAELGTDPAGLFSTLKARLARYNDLTTLTDAATIAWDMQNTNVNLKVTLAGNRTLGAPTNVVARQMGLIEVHQDATGSRTLAFNSAYKFIGGTAPTLTTTASAKDVLAYYAVSSSEIWIVESLNFS